MQTNQAAFLIPQYTCNPLLYVCQLLVVYSSIHLFLMQSFFSFSNSTFYCSIQLFFTSCPLFLFYYRAILYIPLSFITYPSSILENPIFYLQYVVYLLCLSIYTIPQTFFNVFFYLSLLSSSTPIVSHLIYSHFLYMYLLFSYINLIFIHFYPSPSLTYIIYSIFNVLILSSILFAVFRSYPSLPFFSLNHLIPILSILLCHLST